MAMMPNRWPNCQLPQVVRRLIIRITKRKLATCCFGLRRLANRQNQIRLSKCRISIRNFLLTPFDKQFTSKNPKQIVNISSIFISFECKNTIKPLNRFLTKNAFLPLFLILAIANCYSQNFSESGLNFGARIGPAKLIGEVPTDFSAVINEFSNKPGLSATFEISKYFSERWEIGIEIGQSNLSGVNYNPNLSAEGFQEGIPAEITNPLEYKNKLTGQNIFCRYYFKPAGKVYLFLPYIRAGIGYLNYNSQFKYIEAPNDKLLFGKGTEGYTKLSTPVFIIGTGFKTVISPNFCIISSVDFNMVDYDFLDVVHNYNAEGKRLQVIGLYSEIKLGILFTAGNPAFNIKNRNSKKNKGRAPTDGYLPFAG